MSDIEQDKLMNSIIFKVHRLVIISNKVADHQLQAEFGMSLSQFLIMYVFEFMPCANQRLVAEALNMSPAGISKHIEKLEKLGWLDKSREQKDRRQHHWQMTAAGREKFNQVYQKMEFLSEDTRSLLQPEEREVFHRCLDKMLAKAIGDYQKEFSVSKLNPNC